MDKQNFIGMGQNPDPDVPDIPLGLGMALFQETDARQFFENLSDAGKTRVIRYVQSGNVTGDDAEAKILTAVDGLKRHDTAFTGQ